MQPNGAEQARTHTHPARMPVEAAFKNAGLTSDQAHDVMDALDNYVLALSRETRITTRTKKSPPKRARSRR